MIIKRGKVKGELILYVDDESYVVTTVESEIQEIVHKGKTVSLRHEPRNWNLVVGGAGGQFSHKYFCEINGVRNDKLEFASASKVSMPDVIRSETLPIYSDTVRREAFSFFVRTLDPVD